MSANALPSSAAPFSVTEALFRARSEASVWSTVYVLGGGALTAAALASLGYGYGYQMTQGLHMASAVIIALALLWLCIGAKFMWTQFRKVQACTVRYEAYVQQQIQAHIKRITSLHKLEAALPICPPREDVDKAPFPTPAQAAARLPVSLFGAYL